MAEVILKNVNKIWKDFHAVKDVSLLIKDNTFFVFLGPSGCGKTTTLRMIAGLEEITSGEIYIGNKKINDLPPRDRDISMVFQNYGLYPHMTVRNNIAYPLKIRKVEKSQHDDLIKSAATKVQMEALLDKKPHELSGGQRQRVALARAIVRHPNCFLMDEPLSNLDAKLRVSTRAEIKLLQKELKITTIYVTHDQIEAMTMADQVAIMNQGIISQLGTPNEIYNTPANTFVAGFIGSPPMNIFQGKIENGCFYNLNIKIPGLKFSAGPILIGFRPEDAEIFPISKSKEQAHIQTTIYNIEDLGDSVIVDLKLDNQVYKIKTSKNFPLTYGDNVGVKISPKLCHYFDIESGKRLESPT